MSRRTVIALTLVCQAPTPDHVRRWAADAGIRIHGFHGVHQRPLGPMPGGPSDDR